MQTVPTLWKANAIVFLASFCVMVIELVAARVLAPAIGVSLYTWTSIIGVILAGIALGNYLGGKIADKHASPTLLATILFAGTLATLAVLPISKSVTSVELFSKLHLMLNSTLTVACIFFIPAIILSMVSPLVIKLTLADLGKTGGVVGTIYACSTAGSILGTFMTGFFFVMWFGTRTTIWLVVIVLFLVGLLAWFSWSIPQRWAKATRNIVLWVLALLIILGSLALLLFRSSWEQVYLKESNYYTIRILTQEDKIPASKDGVAREMKVLALDNLIHSYIIPDDPTFFHYEYLKIFEDLVAYSKPKANELKVLHLGGGGYSFPKFLDATYPGSINDVVEIDPAVTEIVYAQLGLPRDTHISTYNEDARIFLSRHSLKNKYDFVIGDVFNDLTTPYHLTTLEFDRMVKASMTQDGLYLVNIIDDYSGGGYLPALINTLKHVFNHVYLFAGSVNLKTPGGYTYVIAATDRVVNLDEFKGFVSARGERRGTFTFQYERTLTNYLLERNPILLTDDYVPTDVLVAPLFRSRAEHK
jgi:spermidine synthase